MANYSYIALATPDGVTLSTNAAGNLEIKDGGVSTAKVAAAAVTSAKMVITSISATDTTAYSNITSETEMTGLKKTITEAGTYEISVALDVYCATDTKAIIRLYKNYGIAGSSILCEGGVSFIGTSSDTDSGDGMYALVGKATLAVYDTINVSATKDSGSELSINKTGVTSGLTPKSSIVARRVA